MDAMTRSRHIAGNGTSALAWRSDAALERVPDVTPDTLLAPGARVVVVAPHPDDEILSGGGLLQMLAGRAVLFVAVTDGEACYPDAPEWPQARLREVRARETLDALACLGIAAPRLERLQIPDGGVTAAEASLATRLAALLQPHDILLTTWRYDGHPDHEATARACASAARERGATLLETPVWGWHWSAPGDGAMPLASARRLPLSPEQVARKRAAIMCFQSQITGSAEPILPAHAIERILHPFELYFHDIR